MATLNVKNFPDALLKRLKVTAAQRGVTLRELVVETFDLSEGFHLDLVKHSVPIDKTVKLLRNIDPLLHPKRKPAK